MWPAFYKIRYVIGQFSLGSLAPLSPRPTLARFFIFFHFFSNSSFLGNLNSHMRLHSWRCEICSLTFPDQNSLRTHELQGHPNIPPPTTWRKMCTKNLKKNAKNKNLSFLVLYKYYLIYTVLYNNILVTTKDRSQFKIKDFAFIQSRFTLT